MDSSQLMYIITVMCQNMDSISRSDTSFLWDFAQASNSLHLQVCLLKNISISLHPEEVTGKFSETQAIGYYRDKGNIKISVKKNIQIKIYH